MIRNKSFLVSYKLFFALLGLSALVTELATLSERGTLNIVNFFSFFTVQNNLLVVLILLLSAFAVSSGKSNRKLDALRGFSTAFILVVGIGFSILLSGLEGVQLTAVPWTNVVLHYIIPAAVLLDYLLDTPRIRLRFLSGLVWLLYPLAYLAYSLIRGHATGWYPYPFLNANKEGYASVIWVSLGLSVVTILIIWLVSKLSSVKMMHHSSKV